MDGLNLKSLWRNSKNENTISYDSLPLIVKATDGDTSKLTTVFYIITEGTTKRSLRPMKDEYGNQSMVVDEVLRGRMETRLDYKDFVIWN